MSDQPTSTRPKPYWQQDDDDTPPRLTPWMESYTGTAVEVFGPRPSQIRLLDILVSIARLPRFNGHTCAPWPYTVGQHTLWVAAFVEDFGGSRAVQQAAFLHDAAEAYLGDVLSPIKPRMPAFIQCEERVRGVICEVFGVAPALLADNLLRLADIRVLRAEARDLLPSRGDTWSTARVDPWPTTAGLIDGERPSVTLAGLVERFEALWLDNPAVTVDSTWLADLLTARAVVETWADAGA